jgi:hypothetical protein
LAYRGNRDIRSSSLFYPTSLSFTTPNNAGQIANGHSFGGRITQDGRYVYFTSTATNFTDTPVPCGDKYCYDQLYVRDRQTGQTTLISRSQQGNPASLGVLPFWLLLTDDNRFITFASQSSDLVPNDINNIYDVFILNLETNAIERVSISSKGTQAQNENNFQVPESISADGRFVLFRSNAAPDLLDDPNACAPLVECSNHDPFLRDRLLGETIRVSYPIEGGGSSWEDVEISSSGDQLFHYDSYSPIQKIYVSAPVNVTLQRPSNVTATPNLTQITLSWMDNTNGAAVYQIERSPNGATEWIGLGTTAAGATTYTDVNPPCGTVYYRLRAFDATNNLYSPYSFNVDAQVCEPPRELVQNGGFEDGGETSRAALHWNGKSLDNDKRVQNKVDKQVAYSGNYAFQFKAGIPSKLTQTIVNPNGQSGQFLKLSAWVEGKNLSGAKVQAKILYNNQPAQKLMLDSAALNAGSYAYKHIMTEATLNSTVSGIKVQISQKNGTGRLRIDEVSLVLSATSTQLLPLPITP